jgi:hypothetical protein
VDSFEPEEMAYNEGIHVEYRDFDRLVKTERVAWATPSFNTPMLRWRASLLAVGKRVCQLKLMSRIWEK